MQLFKYASLLVTTFLLSISSVSAQDLYRTIDVIPLSENCDWAVAPDSSGVVFSTTDGGVADYLVGITTDAGFSSAVVSASANDLLVEQDDGSGLGFAMPRVLQGDNEVAYVMEITIDPFGDLLSGNPLSGNESGKWLDGNASWFNGTFGNGWSQASFGANNDEGGYWWGVGQVYLGYWDAGVGAVKGTYYVCRHPIQTGQGVITSIAHPIQTYNAITEDLSEKSGTLRGKGSIVGGVLIGIGTAGTVGIAAKTGTLAKVVRKLKRTPDVPDTNVPGGVAPIGVRPPSDVLMPGGQQVGRAGSSQGIRRVDGGLPKAQEMFDELAAGGRDVTPPGHPGKLVELPDGGRVGLRPVSGSADKSPSVDVNIPGIPVKKIHFEP